MDLPTCPACKQSVLDEDAAECPFCGASMKGGSSPGRSGSAAAPARKAPPRSAPPAKLDTAAASDAGTTEKPRPGAAKAVAAKPEDDDPFAVDPAASMKAAPVSARPAPGKTLEVKCPMCETAGFVSPKAAGQPVKCCNPKCLVPIFTVPAPQKVEAPPPPPPKKSPVALYAGIAVVAVIAGGVLVWQFSGPPPRPVGANPPNVGILPADLGAGQPAAVVDGTRTGSTATGDKADKKAAVVPADVSSAAALTSQALKRLVELSLSAPSNRKAYCRRLAATAFIEAGEFARGREQIEQLTKVGQTKEPFEACLPTVLLAWRQGSAAYAKGAAESKPLADNLPSRGRYAIEAGLSTAALLAAADQFDEARKMLAAHKGSPELNQLAAASQIVQHDGTYDLDASLVGRSLGDWLAPLEIGVTLILTAHGRWDEAKRWADQTPDPAARAEAIVVWAEAYARSVAGKDAAADLQRAEAAADALAPSVKARLLARLAAVRLAAGNRASAEALLEESRKLVASIPVPPAIRVQGAKSFLDLKLPGATDLHLAALAAAEVGLVQQQLQQVEPAWNSFQLALRFLRGTAPALGLTQPRRAALDGDGAEAIRTELKTAMALKTDDQVRQNFTRYRQKADELLRASANRFLWQSELLDAAARAGLVDQVWSEIQVGDARPDATEREPFLASAAPYVVAIGSDAAGKSEQAATIRKLARERYQSASPEAKIRIAQVMSGQAIDAGKLADASQQLEELLSDTGVLHEWSMRLACRLVRAGKVAEALQSAGALRSTVLREDELYLVSALAARLGHATEIWKKGSTGTAVTESAAICAGMVAGLSSPSAVK